MTLTPPLRQFAALSILALTVSVASTLLKAQQAGVPVHMTVLLDPAHGGPDAGAHLDDDVLEKDVTLGFASRLRAALGASGFAVIATRDSDPAVAFPPDQRAEIANHARPAVCLILHASAAGSGVHIVSSALPLPVDETAPTHAAIPWNTAQTGYLPQSLVLANDLGVALLHSKLPFTVSRAFVRPLDTVTCPAVVIEIAPLPRKDDDPAPVTDAAYQQRVVQAISAALVSWRNQSAVMGEAR